MLRNGYYLLSSYFPRDYNIKITDTYSEINDGDLDSVVKEITSANPNIGYRGVKSHLEARNLKDKYPNFEVGLKCILMVNLYLLVCSYIK